MSTESNNNPENMGVDNVQSQNASQQPEVTKPDDNQILDYNDSPHKGVRLDEDKPENKDLFFGKYKSIQDAEDGYKNAVKKIQEQGSELNKLREEKGLFEPMKEEIYQPDKWKETIESWKKEEIIPEGSYDPDIPEMDMLMAGFKHAGISEKQAKSILAGAVERQMKLVEERQEAVKQDLGVDGMKKVEALTKFATGLSEEDRVIFESLFTFPYVEANQVDLMHRLLVGEGEKNIPTGPAQEQSAKSSADIYKDIMMFQKEYGRQLHTDNNLQQKLDDLWGKYEKAKSRGF